MTTKDLAHAYLDKATKRMRALEVLRAEDAFSDVVREAQELVELCLKGMLRFVGVEPPHWHDVGDILLMHRDLFPGIPDDELVELAEASRRLKRERELSFCGAIDFIPTEEYGVSEADRALGWARKSLDVFRRLLPDESVPRSGSLV